jgi:hypothetical protein
MNSDKTIVGMDIAANRGDALPRPQHQGGLNETQCHREGFGFQHRSSGRAAPKRIGDAD